MSTPPNSMFAQKLSAFLGRAELVLVAAVVAVLLAKYSGYDVDQILVIALSSLACVYFLLAYSPPAPVEDNGTGTTKLGFLSLLFMTILPKINGISASVSLVGILFYLLHLPGARQMLLIGGMTLAAGVVLSVLGIAMGNQQAQNSASFLYRSIPISLITLYYFSQL